MARREGGVRGGGREEYGEEGGRSKGRREGGVREEGGRSKGRKEGGVRGGGRGRGRDELLINDHHQIH